MYIRIKVKHPELFQDPPLWKEEWLDPAFLKAILYHNVLHSTILYYAIPYYILYYTILYSTYTHTLISYTILHYTIVIHTILYAQGCEGEHARGLELHPGRAPPRRGLLLQALARTTATSIIPLSLYIYIYIYTYIHACVVCMHIYIYMFTHTSNYKGSSPTSSARCSWRRSSTSTRAACRRGGRTI